MGDIPLIKLGVFENHNPIPGNRCRHSCCFEFWVDYPLPLLSPTKMGPNKKPQNHGSMGSHTNTSKTLTQKKMILKKCSLSILKCYFPVEPYMVVIPISHSKRLETSRDLEERRRQVHLARRTNRNGKGDGKLK